MTTGDNSAGEKKQQEEVEEMGGVSYDGTVDIEEVIIDGEVYEIDETD